VRRAFTGGRILTQDPNTPAAEAVVVEDGKIVAVGDRALGDQPDTEIVDLAGATLVPGLIDAHNHLSVSALHPHWHDVTGVGDRETLAAAIVAQAAAWPDSTWVRCQGLDLMGPGSVMKSVVLV
jgi:predicted amidohydrolase YtcJ